ncbi:MAG: hypothetical protein B7Z66_03105 [Chromatiales bacterium 21-64-14]|nr:MAG: hypothetical protein B7Z66_03105 [Chromatiales bacterium 21-64-14]
MVQDMDRQIPHMPHMPAGTRELGMAMHQRAGRFAVAAQDAAVSGQVHSAYTALHALAQAGVRGLSRDLSRALRRSA